MDINTAGTIAGVLIAAAGLFMPTFLSNLSAKHKEFKKAAEGVLEKLLNEMYVISDGGYPFRSITDKDIFKLLPHTSKRRKRALLRAYDSYIKAHQVTAKTSHWHDDHSSETVFFPMAFILTNSQEVLEEMESLKKELSR